MRVREKDIKSNQPDFTNSLIDFEKQKKKKNHP